MTTSPAHPKLHTTFLRDDQTTDSEELQAHSSATDAERLRGQHTHTPATDAPSTTQQLSSNPREAHAEPLSPQIPISSRLQTARSSADAKQSPVESSVVSRAEQTPSPQQQGCASPGRALPCPPSASPARHPPCRRCALGLGAWRASPGS